MRAMAGVVLVLGVIGMVGSIVMVLASDPHLPLPLAVCGAGFFIGGAVLASR
jgi:hypothetical protein